MTDGLPTTEEEYLAGHAQPRRPGQLTWSARCGLLGLVMVPVVVFLVAYWIDPYRDGRVWLEETHTQLGMQTCYFRKFIGLPCPSCGMTSSFALFVRGDLSHSLQANAAGTLLAVISLLFIFWGLVTAVRGRMVWLRSWEPAAVWLVLTFAAVMLVRWGIVMAVRLGSA
jgi:Protein of unknown function (DUF2752)